LIGGGENQNLRLIIILTLVQITNASNLPLLELQHLLPDLGKTHVCHTCQRSLELDQLKSLSSEARAQREKNLLVSLREEERTAVSSRRVTYHIFREILSHKIFLSRNPEPKD
jgi:hypothetical protein